MRTITAFSASLPMSRSSRPLVRILVCLLITTAIYYAFAVSMADAATYYLNNSIGDDSYNGLAPQYDGNNGPWLTLTHTKTVVDALSTKGCGSTVIVYQGTGSTYGIYDEGNTTSEITRTGPEYLTYRAAPGETPIFSGIRLIVAGASYKEGYLAFDGIKITPGVTKSGSGLRGVSLQHVGHISLSNLKIIGTGYVADSTNPAAGIYVTACNDINVNNSSIYGDANAAGRDSEIGFQFGVYSRNCSRINITGCSIRDCAQALSVWGDTWNISKNQLYNLDSDGIILNYCANVTIADNVIHDMTPPRCLNDSTGATYNNATKTITANSGTPYPSGLDYYLRIIRDVNGVEVYVPNADPISVFTNYTKWYKIAKATSNTIVLTSAIGADYNDIKRIEVVRGYHSDGIQLQDSVTPPPDAIPNSYNIVISGNQIYNSNRQGLHLWPYNRAHDITLKNNLVYGTNNDFQFGVCSDITLINNTCQHCEFRSHTTVAKMASNIMTNVWIDSTTPDVNYEDYDIVESFSSRIHHDPSFTPGAHTIDFSNHGDGNSPKTFAQWKAIFKDYNNRDFTLAKNSCAIGHADPNNHTATDILGVVRDSSPDAGCYEYVVPGPSNHASVLGTIGDNKTVDENSP